MHDPARHSSPIHVCHVITGLGTGGAEMALYRLLQSIDTERFRASVVSLTDAGTLGAKISELGIPLACLGMRTGTLPFQGLIRLRKHLNRSTPDVIQSWMYHANLLTTLTGTRTPVIWNIRHSLDDLQDETPATRLVIRACGLVSRRAAGIIYNSARSREQHERCGYCSLHSCMIPNGFELNRSVDETARVQIRQSLGIPLDAPVIGRIGRFHPAKDYKTFFQAAAVLNRSHPETHFVLCGREVTLDNRYVNQLLEQHAVENLHLLGERSDVSNLLPAMDMVCSSSATESFPTVLGEAMAAGIPCVATDVGDSTQIIGDTGLITPPRNVSALAQALQRMVQMPASERTALGQQARARISQHYSLSAVSDRYHRLYQSVYEAA